MDFLDPKKRRAHQTRLFIGYALMAVLVLGIATLMVFQSFGYSFNPRTGDISQNGLVFVDAHPQAADVILNGQSKGFTDRRLVMPAGNYTLELKREGYRDWRRDFVLEGGHIERFVYPFLFPTNLVTNQAQLYRSQPKFATQSPDRRWLLVQRPGALSAFDLVDLNTETATATQIALPDGLMTSAGTKHVVELVEWSTDNRHLIVKHTYDKSVEYILIDREVPAESVNLSKVFTQPFTSITLRDKRFDRYYFYDSKSKVLSASELQSRAVTPVLENVLQYRTHGSDEILYTTPSTTDKNKTAARVLQKGQSYTIRELPKDSKFLLDIAQFENKWYVVIGAISEEKTYVYRDPVSTLERGATLIPAAILRQKDARFVSFSNNARIIAVQTAGTFAVYDAETDKIYHYNTGKDVPSTQKATWMDGHRLTLVHDNQVTVFDFDGINMQTLSSSYGAFIPYFDRDYTALYTLAPAPNIKDRAALLRTELIYEP